MQPSSPRSGDYRLAIYVVFAALIAGGATYAFDRITAPSVKIAADGLPAPTNGVRKIPISRTSAADIGDPDNKLTPIYPASPGKDLPVKDTPVRAASTTGSGGAQAATSQAQAAAPPATAPAAQQPQAQASQPQMQTVSTDAAQTPDRPQAANSCNVAACAAAYRSFRESDCTYQPFDGPRRVCEGAPGGNASNAQASVQPQDRSQDQPAARSRYDNAAPRSRYESDLREVERAVRRLPPPGVNFDDEEGGITVVEQPGRRYELRRNWITEPEE